MILLLLVQIRDIMMGIVVASGVVIQITVLVLSDTRKWVLQHNVPLTYLVLADVKTQI